MLIVFKSDAAADVIMFGDIAIELLGVMGKAGGKQGIFTVEQLPDAIARLRRASTTSKSQSLPDDEDEESPHERQPNVSLAQRAAPLIELFEHSLKDKVPVTWGNP